MGIQDKPHETSVRALISLPFLHLLPLALVLAYRKIPAGIRGRHFPGPSTSAQALEGVRSGQGWRAVSKAVRLRW